MLAWFRAFMPKEDKFFDLFDRHSRVLVDGAQALRHLLEGGDSVPHYCRTIVDREHDADAIAREVLLAVRRSFITPFDRSDITDLIQSMDDSIDQMHQTGKTVTLFELRSFEPTMHEMGEIILQAANLTARAVPLLRSIGTHAGELNAYAEKVVELEGRADDLHDEGLRSLYAMHRDGNTMDYVIGAEVYSRLERVVDSFEDVANEITGLVIEHL